MQQIALLSSLVAHYMIFFLRDSHASSFFFLLFKKETLYIWGTVFEKIVYSMHYVCSGYLLYEVAFFEDIWLLLWLCWILYYSLWNLLYKVVICYNFALFQNKLKYLAFLSHFAEATYSTLKWIYNTTKAYTYNLLLFENNTWIYISEILLFKKIL